MSIGKVSTCHTSPLVQSIHLPSLQCSPKVDCTVEKKLCKTFGVKGYPTLKYYRDGDFQDYPLGRDKDSIITFGEKMSNRAVHLVSKDAYKELLDKTPVAFIVFDPVVLSSATNGADAIEASGASEADKAAEKMIQSTERTRAFGQVARKMQAQGSFGLLQPGTSPNEITQFFKGDDAAAKASLSGGFIARIEEDVPIKLYEGELTTASFLEFAKENNMPTVVELGGHNFRSVSRKGRPLAIGVYDPNKDTETEQFQRKLKEYAITDKHKDNYIFSAMDGIKWEKFLRQFSIQKENLPELFVLDTSTRQYWQDRNVNGISEFFTALRNGDIEPRIQEKKNQGSLPGVLQLLVDHMPYSLVAMIGIIVIIFCMVLPLLGEGPIVPKQPSSEAAKKDQ